MWVLKRTPITLDGGEVGGETRATMLGRARTSDEVLWAATAKRRGDDQIGPSGLPL